jgi:prepilin-type N-terminal cleavage/methylation domain-containing protein
MPPVVARQRCRVHRRRQRDETGFTLVEVTITLVILGIAVVALLNGLLAAIGQSNFHRKDAIVDTTLRDYAENIKYAVLLDCPQSTAGATFTVTYTPPTGYSATSAPALPANSPCPSPTQTVTLTSSDDTGTPSARRTSASLTIVLAVP